MRSFSRSQGCSPELGSQVLPLFPEDLPRADLRGHRPSLGPQGLLVQLGDPVEGTLA